MLLHGTGIPFFCKARSTEYDIRGTEYGVQYGILPMNRLQGECRSPKCVGLKLRLRLEELTRMPAVLRGVVIIIIPIRRYDYGLRIRQDPPFTADARVKLVQAALN